MTNTKRLTVWRFLDNRTGHRNQTLGLTDALGELCDVVACDVSVADGLRGLRCLLPGRLDRLRASPAPDLLIGAGHATHLPLLAARRRFGGRSVVLMKPSLPLSWFDLCLIARADELRRVPSNVVLTEGAINRVKAIGSREPALNRTLIAGREGSRRAETAEPFVAFSGGSTGASPSQLLQDTRFQRGLIMIGGPSDHYRWDDQIMLDQIAAVMAGSPGITWTLTTSRRTPSTFLPAWTQRSLPGDMIPVEQTSPTWLPTQLQSSGTVWVSADSVSMVYEALTSGAAVGLLSLAPRRESRVVRGMNSLVERCLVTEFCRWSQGASLPHSPTPLNEAKRCAAVLMSHLFPDRQLSPTTIARVA